MKKIKMILSSVIATCLIATLSYAQTPSEYADDEVIIIFEDGTTQTEIDDVLDEFEMQIKLGPTPYTKAYLLEFIADPPDWAYENPIDPINGVIVRAKTKSSTSGVGLNYEIDQPGLDLRGRHLQHPPSDPCYEVFEENERDNGGNSIQAAIFDTGVSLFDHVLLNLFDPNDLGFNYINVGSDPIDDNDHGTHVSSIVGHHLPNDNGAIKIDAYKTHNMEGISDTYKAIQALDEAIAQNVQAVNMSFSSTIEYAHRLDPYAPFAIALEIAVENNDMLFIAAAGNNGTSNDDPNELSAYPASYLNDNIIAVASVDCNKNRSSWSSYGRTSVDIAAPGENIWGVNQLGEYFEMSGTSQATAFVTKLALYLATFQSSFEAEAIKCAIMNGSIPLSGEQFVASDGYLDVETAKSALDSGIPCDFVPSPPGGSGNVRPANRVQLSNDLAIQPSSFGTLASFEITSATDQTAQVMISNILGEQLLHQKIELQAGVKTYDFDFSRKANLGIYFITVSTGKEMLTLKFKQ